MPDPIASEVAKWRSWIEGPIRTDVVSMHFKRMMWREVNAMLEANPPVAESPSAFWDFLWDNYATAQAIAIRRQADVRRDTCSLGRLITEMSGRADRLTREYYVSLLGERIDDELMVQWMNRGFDRLADGADRLDPKVCAQDLKSLRDSAREVIAYVDEHVAHDAVEPTAADMPTYGDIHRAIDAIGEVFNKYSVALTGGWWHTLEPVIQGDWQAIFRLPWIAS